MKQRVDKHQKQNRGIALITVLIVAGLLMMLLGSFAQINQQHFSMLKNDQSHAAATQTAYSAFDYCTFKLEHNRSWGAAPFAGESENFQNLLTVTYADGSTQIRGTSSENHADFEATILNNIDGNATVDGVEKGFCRVRIAAKRGSAKVKCEALLQTAPIFDGSVVASQNIHVDGEKFVMESTDPFRNRLRAKNSISLPDYDHFQLRPTTANGATEKGVLWAQNGISIGGRDLQDAGNAAEAVQRTGGQFFPGATTHHDVYDLKLNQVRASETPAKINSGVYVFGERTVTYTSNDEQKTAVIPVLERRDWAIDSNGELDYGNSNLREVWYQVDHLPDDADDDWLDYTGDIPQDGMHPVDEASFALDTGVTVKFNSLDPDYTGTFRAPEIVLNADLNLTVDGDFGLSSHDPEFSPVLTFMDPVSGSTTQDHNGLVSGSITTKRAGDYDPLTNKLGKEGSIYIEGKIEGSGKFLAEGNVTIKNTFANVTTDKLSDLSIYSGGSVKLHPKLAKIDDDGTSKDSDGDTAFRGLIFAKEDVSINAFGAVEGTYNGLSRPNLHIEGAVVAREGSVHIANFENAILNYNPDYLDSILDRSKGETRIRLERVVWKES